MRILGGVPPADPAVEGWACVLRRAAGLWRFFHGAALVSGQGPWVGSASVGHTCDLGGAGGKYQRVPGPRTRRNGHHNRTRRRALVRGRRWEDWADDLVRRGHRIHRPHFRKCSWLYCGEVGRSNVVYRNCREQDWANHHGGSDHRICPPRNPYTHWRGSPLSIVAGPDGALWFTEYYASKIGRITTAGVLTEYQISSHSDDIVAGPDGAPERVGRGAL